MTWQDVNQHSQCCSLIVGSKLIIGLVDELRITEEDLPICIKTKATTHISITIPARLTRPLFSFGCLHSARYHPACRFRISLCIMTYAPLRSIITPVHLFTSMSPWHTSCLEDPGSHIFSAYIFRLITLFSPSRGLPCFLSFRMIFFVLVIPFYFALKKAIDLGDIRTCVWRMIDVVRLLGSWMAG